MGQHRCQRHIFLFENPLTLDPLKNPVPLVETLNVYDRETLINWFCKSDIDPLTGINLDNNMLKYTLIINYYMAMLLLECSQARSLRSIHYIHTRFMGKYLSHNIINHHKVLIQLQLTGNINYQAITDG